MVKLQHYEMKRIYLLFFFILCIATSLLADATFTVIPPRNVIAGNKFNVTFRLKNGEGSGLKAPEIEGCTLLFGPSTSTMQNYQWVNGKSTSSTTVDYSFVYKAEKAGSYTIEAATINVDGKVLTTTPTTFNVLPADQPANGNQGVRVDDINSQSSDKTISQNDVFVRIILNKSKAYEQEPIVCTIKLYTKYSISSFMPTTQPSFDGFLIEELNLQPQLNEVEHYNGQNYMTATLKQCLIFPQKSGKLTINSGKYDISVFQHERIGGFWGGTRPVERQIKVSSNSASINIDPLPQPQPDGFSGAVGKFNINSKLSSSKFKTNEAASLTYTISGSGNIKYLKEPEIDFPSEFEVYTPQSSINAHVSGTTMTGTMTIDYTFVPQSVGDFTIGSDTFIYFNPATRQYETIETSPYNISVGKGVATSTTTHVDQQGISAKNTDILHIKMGDLRPSHKHTLITMSWWYWPLYILLACVLIAAIWIYGKQLQLNADIQGRKLANANKIAKKRLKIAKSFMDSHDNDKFYEEMLRAVWGYISDKLGIAVSQLSRDTIAEELARYGANETISSKFINVLDECEMARYSPAKSEEQIGALYAMASQAMNEMENIKRGKRQ